MGCGCSGGTKAALKGVQKYKVEGTNQEYLTEREAIAAKETLGLAGKVVPVQ
jgi:hypothetical protein